MIEKIKKKVLELLVLNAIVDAIVYLMVYNSHKKIDKDIENLRSIAKEWKEEDLD